MTTMQQAMIRFAARHDWGSTARVVDGGIRVTGTVRMADGTLTSEAVTLQDMQQLRDWAGY